MDPPAVRDYLRTQGLVTAAINAVVNPALARVLPPRGEPLPLAGLAVDTAVTCLVLSVLVSLFTSAGVRRALRSGQVSAVEGGAGVLSSLPRGPGLLGLALGVGAACVLAPLAVALFAALGLAPAPFGTFAVFKAIYTAALGYAVTRWVILRQIQGEARES